MKNLLRKLHIAGTHDEPLEGSGSSSGKAQEGSGATSLRNRLSFAETSSTSPTDQKPLSALSGWLNSVARHTLTPSSANQNASQGSTGVSPKDRTDAAAVSLEGSEMEVASPNAGSAVAKLDSPIAGFVSSEGSEERKVDTPVNSSTVAEEPLDEQASSLDEEYQVLLAMALSANDDPEAVQIETVKQISLGAYPSHGNTSAEVVAHRYWNYNILNYDDKVLDGFYDVYGVSDSTSEMMPSLVELQGTPVSGNIIWEVVLVNRSTDPELVNLEQKAVTLAVDFRVEISSLFRSNLVQKIADLVVQHMGGAVTDSDDMFKQWRRSSEELMSSLGSIVLPLGCLRIGLTRHRALLFKVLADTVEIPCRLLKGRHYTGSEEGAVNIIRLDDDREYIIDLMGAPGTLIPSDITGLFPLGADFEIDRQRAKGCSPGYSELEMSQPCSSVLETLICKNEQSPRSGDEQVPGEGIKDAEKFPEYLAGTGEGSSQVSRKENSANDADIDTLQDASIAQPYVQNPEHLETDMQEVKHVERHHSEPPELQGLNEFPPRAAVARSSHPFAHWRSPSWTEGIGSPAARDMKVKNVSHYVVHAAKENPELAQKLHNVLLESGVVAPPDLFADISPKQLQAKVAEERKIMEEKEAREESRGNAVRRKEKSSVGPGRPPAPAPKHSSEIEGNVKDRPQRLNSVEGLGERRPLETLDVSATPPPVLGLAQALAAPLQSPSPVTEAATLQLPNPVASAVVQENIHPEVIKRVPVAAAAAAAVVASSMVVAAAKNEVVPDPTLEVPLAAAARATAAVVMATSAVVGRKLDISETVSDARNKDKHEKTLNNNNRRSGEVEGAVVSPVEGVPKCTNGKGLGGGDFPAEQDRASDKSSGSVSAKPDAVLDDVAEWEIPWEDILIGERIGLGSYGEVYHGEWHGTEVAVKKFLDQDISGDALEEFRSEVRIMRRLRHPNVVLFMGAVTRAPNLSIVTEFLPRGSLYKLIHRPNNQLDERRRLRMALDVARGMNYLHSSTPVIVHRDLKSPNLLVDKNWVVKVCDFGLSRMKHNTFLSSKSTAGTPEWMAPEVLRNEPSNEKCDVYSFGVILWELATLHQPWGGMNPMQVVGAVGFQHRHLDIPDDMDPVIAKIILQCWQSNPNYRPSFAEIMAALKPLQRPVLTSRTPETGRPGIVVNHPV